MFDLRRALLIALRRRYCQAHLMAYLSGELPPAARRRMAALIDSDPACYAAYARQRAVQRGLTADLPPVGQPTAPALDSMWARIQAEVSAPAAPLPPVSWGLRVRYGVLGTLAALMLTLPMALGSTPLEARAQVSTQPVPRIAEHTPADRTAAPLSTGAALPTHEEPAAPALSTPQPPSLRATPTSVTP